MSHMSFQRRSGHAKASLLTFAGYSGSILAANTSRLLQSDQILLSPRSLQAGFAAFPLGGIAYARPYPLVRESCVLLCVFSFAVWSNEMVPGMDWFPTLLAAAGDTTNGVALLTATVKSDGTG